MKASDRAKETVAYWELIGKSGNLAPVVIQRYTLETGGEPEALNGLERVLPYYDRCWVVKVIVVTERTRIADRSRV
jgi:hypothetical protein